MKTETKPARIYLKTPHKKWLWLGGLAACLIPLLCGLVFMAFILLVNSLVPPDEFDVENFPLLSTLILGVIPVIGGTLAAYLGTREILKKNKTGFASKNSFAWVAVKVGLFVHWVIAFLLFILILAFGVWKIGIVNLMLFIITGTIGTFVLYMLVTLPVSLASGYIFWFVAVRGGENLMAETFD